MSATATLAPSRANASAAARPIPFAAPVTNATFPVKSPFPFVPICLLLFTFVSAESEHQPEQDSVGILLGKLDGHLYRPRYDECFCTSIDFCDWDNAGRRYRLSILAVVDSDLVIRRPISDIADFVRSLPKTFLRKRFGQIAVLLAPEQILHRQVQRE